MSSQPLPPLIQKNDFGALPDGVPVHLFTMRNPDGMEVAFMDYGATLVRVRVPDRHGVIDDVALGFDSLGPYLEQSAYLGATIGRYANRIAEGRLVIDGKLHQLPVNNGRNTLHGGDRGFDKQMWQAEILAGHEPAVRFSRISPDGEEGFPGELAVSVTCQLRAAGELEISFEAASDRATVVNLTNHAYFNLAGSRSSSVLDHLVTIHADHYTPVNENLIPTGELAPVAGTAMDFTTPTAIGARMNEVAAEPPGYDHNYVLRKSRAGAQPELAATVFDPSSGREMHLWTSEPGIQFYSANYFDDAMTGRNGQPYGRHGAFALEPQHFPDSPNQPRFPSAELRPGEKLAACIMYRFGVR